MDHSISVKPYILFFVITIFFFSCQKNEDNINPVPVETLESYVNQYNHLEREILIACAASEPATNTNFLMSVYFYPYPGAQEYRYFESSSVNIDPKDYNQYKPIDLPSLPVFNGYLRRFPHPGSTTEKWAIVTYFTDGKLHICDPIRLKQEVRPTLYAPEMIQIDLSSATEPIFSWEEDSDSENIIYFQVVTDSVGGLISGTYTYDKYWQFYNLSNVVLNIKVQDPPQILHLNRKYKFTLMGVSEDNWVNLVGEKIFITE